MKHNMGFFSKDCQLLCLNQVKRTMKTEWDSEQRNTATEKQKRMHMINKPLC